MTWFWFLAPSLVLVLVFFVLPFILNVPFAFSQWSGYSPVIRFIGQFLAVVEQRNAWRRRIGHALLRRRSNARAKYGLPLPRPQPLRDTTRLNSVFRSLFFLPVLISPLAAGYIWRAIVDPAGPLNGFNSSVFPHFSYAWLGHPASALVTVASIDGWKWSGIATLVYIAGLNSIPEMLNEAAKIDGAGAWQRFWRVSFPLLAPAFTFNDVTTLIGALSAYNVVASTTSGGPGTATTTLNVAVQQQSGLGYFGTASTLSLTVTVLVIAFAVPLVAWLRKREIA